MQIYNINRKAVDFERAADLLKPLSEWKVGDLMALEELGVRFPADGKVQSFSLTEAAAIVYHVARRANRVIVFEDIKALSPAELGTIVVALQERMAPPAEAPEESPLASASSGPPTSSDKSTTGPLPT